MERHGPPERLKIGQVAPICFNHSARFYAHGARPAWRRDPQSKAIVDRYEQLRDQSLGVSFVGGKGLGAALFTRRGMGAWLEAWVAHVPTPRVERPVEPRSGYCLASDTAHRVTAVLTDIILDLNRLEIEHDRTGQSESHGGPSAS